MCTLNAVLKNMGVWIDKHLYDEAERLYYEKMAKNPPKKVSLAGEVAKARERIKQSLENANFEQLKTSYISLEKTVKEIEKKIPTFSTTINDSKNLDNKKEEDVDLFGSESENEDEEAQKIKEQRLAEYTAKKSKKPIIVAKSNIILDVKPWDDETDMKELEKAVRLVEMDGLIWGASKLVPLAYGIQKLQISCVVEDDKVSVDELQEKIQDITDYVQSIDIAAFNKV
ncbi:hypothetical protein PGB90_010099 [Kerria lacca]